MQNRKPNPIAMIAFAGLVTLTLQAASCKTTAEGGANAIMSMAESGSYEALGPAGTGAELLLKSGDLSKVALIKHFRGKATQASIDQDFDKADWYEAHVTCLSGDCSRLRALEKQRAINKKIKPIGSDSTEAVVGGEGESGGGGSH
ncbi:MAG: hypothetical protein Q8O63_05450 [Hoeflea sp.]|nr:hypothetical protein [Hoeflea sp.]